MHTHYHMCSQHGYKNFMRFYFLGMNMQLDQMQNRRMDGYSSWGGDSHGMQHNTSMNNQSGESIQYLRSDTVEPLLTK